MGRDVEHDERQGEGEEISTRSAATTLAFAEGAIGIVRPKITEERYAATVHRAPGPPRRG
jgi:hypothetical protein